MAMTIDLGRRVAVLCIGTGTFIFVFALVIAIWMFLSVFPGEGAGLTLVPGFILFNAYIVLSLCNLIGGLIIYFLSSKSQRSYSRGTKIIFFFAAIAQAVPAIMAIYANYSIGQ